MIDIISYLIGLLKGKRSVELEGGDYVFTDANSDGNIVIAKEEAK